MIFKMQIVTKSNGDYADHHDDPDDNHGDQTHDISRRLWFFSAFSTIHRIANFKTCKCRVIKALIN